MKLRGVFGSGGCGRGIMPLVRAQEAANTRYVFVDDATAGSKVNEADVLSLAEFTALAADDKAICLAVADPNTRYQIAQRCSAAGVSFFAVRAVNHLAMDDVAIGKGALISPFTTFTSNVRIGDHFHCNLYSYVEHDCVIGNFVTFAPAVCCNGNVSIGDGAYIGSHAAIRQGISVGMGATVGMGAVVTKNVPAGETWAGNPARRLISK